MVRYATREGGRAPLRKDMSDSRPRHSLWLTLLVGACMPVVLSAQTGSVTGLVWDSIGSEPLSDAAVFLWGTPYRGVSDSEGRFRIDDVPPGEYSLLFFHTRLGEMGVSPGPMPVGIEGARTLNVDLATPSMATVVRSQCLMEDRPEGAGALAGRVFDGDSNVPLSGALVTLSWDVEGQSTPDAASVRSGSEGWYRSCAVPSDRPVLLGVDYIGRQSQRKEYTVPAGGYTETLVPLYSLTPSRVSGHLVDATSEESIEGAEAWLRGTAFRTLSDSRGNFRFENVPPGTYMMMTDHLAYGTKMDTLVVPEAMRLAVDMRLDDRPIEIAPLTVTVEAPPVEMARIRGGIVVTRQEIDRVRQTSRDASDILRSLHLPGVIVRHQSNGTICVGYITGQVKMNQTGCVEMMIYINDVRATDSDLALRLPPDAVERMVIYKPLEAGNLFGLGGGNGVWVIYTRGN